MPTAPSYLELIHQIALACQAGPVSIRSFLRQRLSRIGFEGESLETAISVRYQKLVREIDAYVDSFDRRRIQEYFSRDPERATHVVALNTSDQYAHTAAVHEAITRLDHRRFEYVAANLLGAYALTRVAVTAAGNDGGFDFAAYCEVDEELSPGERYTGPHWFMGMRVFVFGQAKRYAINNTTSPEGLRLLKGDIQALKDGGGTDALDCLLEVLKDWDWRPARQCRGVFVTSGFFNSTAPGFAQQHEMALIDGEQLAQCLLDRLPSDATLDRALEELQTLAEGPMNHVQDLDL